MRLITILHRRWPWIVGAVMTAAVASAIALVHPGLVESYTLRSFVGSQNRAFDDFQGFMNEFAGSELALIAVRSADALSDEVNACLRDLGSGCAALPAVHRVRSIASLPALGRTMWVRHPLIDGLLISADRRTAGIVMQMQPEAESGDLRRQTVDALRDLVARAAREHPSYDIILTGPYVTMLQMFELVHRDMAVFSVAISIIMILALLITLRSWRAAAYAFGAAACATLCTLGLMAAGGINVSLLVQTTIILVSALTVAACVHIAVAHHEILTAGPDGGRARTLRHMLAPSTAVILTTAGGFASVTLSEIQPIRTFGMVMVFGLVVALVAALSGTMTLPERPVAAGRGGWIGSVLLRLGTIAVARPVRMIVVFVLATVALAAPIPTLRFESQFVENFRATSSVRTGYEFVEENLAPLNSIELVITAHPDRPLVDLHTVKACAAIGDWAVATHEPVAKSLSIADLVSSPGLPMPATDGELQARLRSIGGVLGAISGDDPLEVFMGASGTSLRISLLSREGIDVDGKLALAHAVHDHARTVLGPGYDVQLTGLYYFYATLMAGLLEDQVRSFALASAAVFVVATLWMRSWIVGLIAMIPNIVTITASLGLMGWLRIPINMATAMMLSIALGIAIDDTLHYVWRVRRELATGSDIPTAVRASHASVGRACCFTTVVLALGFWVLCFSQFLPMAYFGAVIGLSMLCALAADLLLLPAVIMVFRGPISRWAQATSA